MFDFVCEFFVKKWIYSIVIFCNALLYRDINSKNKIFGH